MKQPLSPAEKRVGMNIRAHREKIGYSQADLAQLIGKSSSIVSCYEIGKYLPSPETIAKISMVLDVGPTDLYKSDDSAKNGDLSVSESRMRVSSSEEIKREVPSQKIVTEPSAAGNRFIQKTIARIRELEEEILKLKGVIADAVINDYLEATK